MTGAVSGQSSALAEDGFAALVDGHLPDRAPEPAASQAPEVVAGGAFWPMLTPPPGMRLCEAPPVPPGTDAERTGSALPPRLPDSLTGAGTATLLPLTDPPAVQKAGMVRTQAGWIAAPGPVPDTGADSAPARAEGGLPIQLIPVVPEPDRVTLPADPPLTVAGRAVIPVIAAAQEEGGAGLADMAREVLSEAPKAEGRPGQEALRLPASPYPEDPIPKADAGEGASATNSDSGGALGNSNSAPDDPQRIRWQVAASPDRQAEADPLQNHGDGGFPAMSTTPTVQAAAAPAVQVGALTEARAQRHERPGSTPEASEGLTDGRPDPVADTAVEASHRGRPDSALETRPQTAATGLALASGLAVTTAERFWLGRLQEQAVPMHAVDPGPTEGRDGPAVTEARDSLPRVRAEPVVAHLPVVPVPVTDPEDDRQEPEIGQASLPWQQPGLPSAPGGQPTGALPSGVAQQFATGMAAALHQRPDGGIEITLSPEELGGVRLRLEPDARDPDRVVVHLAFDRPETMDLFRRHADQLAEAIRAAGYAETRLDFGQAGTGAQAGNGQAHFEHQGEAMAPGAENATEPGLAPVRTFPLQLGGSAGLDLRL
jgi:hypothetical protein